MARRLLFDVTFETVEYASPGTLSVRTDALGKTGDVDLIWKISIDLSLFCASVLSGMLGIGVAFAAIPILSLTGGDLVHELQPVALFLNGITALFAAVSFSRAGHVDWERTIPVSVVATLFSPLGAYLAHLVDTRFLWTCYLAAVVAVVLLLLIEVPERQTRSQSGYVLLSTAPISFFSGMLGVGPGFLLVPALILLGTKPRSAAAMNSVAVVPSSFSALIPHISQAHVDVQSYVPIVAIAAAGALLGGYLASHKVAERGLRYLFVVVMLCLALYKGITLFGPSEMASAALRSSCGSPPVVPASSLKEDCQR